MKKLILLTIALLAALGIRAQESARQALISMPLTLNGMIDRTERLDMIDFFEAKLLDRTVNTRRGAKARLTELTDTTYTIENGEVEKIYVRLLPGKSDTLIAVIRTLATPTPDSSLAIFDSQWQPKEKAWREPSAKDWGKPSAKFLLTEYALRGDTLTLTDQTAAWNPDGAPTVKELKYVWNRKSEKFVPLN